LVCIVIEQVIFGGPFFIEIPEPESGWAWALFLEVRFSPGLFNPVGLARNRAGRPIWQDPKLRITLKLRTRLKLRTTLRITLHEDNNGWLQAQSSKIWERKDG
jgi:hypothetical protein